MFPERRVIFIKQCQMDLQQIFHPKCQIKNTIKHNFIAQRKKTTDHQEFQNKFKLYLRMR